MLQKLKIPFAIFSGFLTAYFLRDMYVGSNYVIMFSLFMLLHVIYVKPRWSISDIPKIFVFVSSAVTIMIYGKGWSAFLLILSYLSLISFSYKGGLSFLTDLVQGLYSSSRNWNMFISSSISEPLGKRGSGKIYTYVIPALLCFVFLLFYSTGSTYFSSFLDSTFIQFGDWLDLLTGNFDFQWFVLFCFGLWLVNVAIHRSSIRGLVLAMVKLPDALQRKRKPIKRNSSIPFNPKTLALKIEYKTAKLVLITLNSLLVITNILDIKNLWFNFNPSSVNLSQFVHEGTYVLIASILLASAILIFYFRGNLNFIKGHKSLKHLGVIWVCQNMVLASSVGVRNFHYISETHALTERRIGVFVFLFLVCIGLASLFKKLEFKKSIAWVGKVNFMLFLFVLSIIQLVNWERVIISYNFSNPNIESIDLTPLFRDVDYDLVFLNKKILEAEGELVYKKYRSHLDAYETWNEKKYQYDLLYRKSHYRSWHYFKHKNLNELRFVTPSYSEAEVYY